jgi:UDP-2-acetamido-3-amino-2,3-dideoxy-glucuronate N-acetyltransferase
MTPMPAADPAPGAPRGPRPPALGARPAGLDPEVFVHPLGLCESASVGRGSRVWAFAHVMAGAILGEDCNVGGHAFVEAGTVVGDRVTIKNGVLLWDKVTVEDDVFLGPNVVFTNDLNPRVAHKKEPSDFTPTLVRSGATIGANATIVCGIEIGQQAFVGAGSVVIRDVGAHALVVGNPARRVGWMCACGRRLDGTLACACGRGYALVPGGAELRAVAGS